MALLFAPRRRYLPSVTLPRGSGWPGAFCSKWEGFEAGWKRAYPSIEKPYGSKPTAITDQSRVDRVGERPGVYVFLTRTLYVLYVGKASSLNSRVWQSLESFPNRQRRIVEHYAVAQARSTLDALKMERALIYYYVPPWNRAIGHRPPRSRDAGEDGALESAQEGAPPVVAKSVLGRDPGRQCVRCGRTYAPGISFCASCEVAL